MVGVAAAVVAVVYFFVVACDDVLHVRHAAVAEFQGVGVEEFSQLVLGWETLFDYFNKSAPRKTGQEK